MKPISKRTGILLLVIAAISIATVAILISGGDYTVKYQSSGLQGGSGEGGNYSARFMLTTSEKSGGSIQAEGGVYSARVGFFEASPEIYLQTRDINLNSGWNLITITVEI